MSMPGSMPLQAREGISSSAAPEPQPRAPRSRALLGRVFLGLCFFGIYLLLTRSDIILQARSGFSVWYPANGLALDRKSTRLNSSHSQISYAVFCLKKKK